MWITDTCYRDAVEIWELDPGRGHPAPDRRLSPPPSTCTSPTRLPTGSCSKHWNRHTGQRSARSGPCMAIARDTASRPGGRWRRQSSGRPGLPPSSTMSTCGPTTGAWRSRASYPVAGRESPGSRWTFLPSRSGRSRCISRASLLGRSLSAPSSVVHERREQLNGEEPAVLADLAGLVAAIDPHVVLFPHADLWLPRILSAAEQEGIVLPFSRSGRYRKLVRAIGTGVREDRVPGQGPSSRTAGS